MELNIISVQEIIFWLFEMFALQVQILESIGLGSVALTNSDSEI